MLRTLLPLLALAGCATSTVTPEDSNAASDLAAFLDARATPEVQVAALVVDLDTGEVLVSREAQRLLRPASTMKVLTTAAVCRRAPGEDVETTLYARTPVGSNVVLVGAGDAFLSTDELRLLVRQLRDAGLESCDGAQVVDALGAAPRFGEGWMWDDEPYTFMPALSAAPIDGGCVTVAVHGREGEMEAWLEPVEGPLMLQLEPGDGALGVTRGRYDEPEVVRVTGRLPRGESRSRRITVPDPSDYTAAVLADALRAEGLSRGGAELPRIVTTDGSVEKGPRAVLRRSVEELVLRTNKDSDNLGAELLLRLLPTLGGTASGLDADSVARGIEALRDDIRDLGLDPDTYRLSDGSGVSHYTLVTAELLVRTLVDMHDRGGRTFEVFEQSLPIAGEDGTLRRRMRGTPAEGRVHAKTGTISGVSNLAGYVTTTSGRRLAFAILVQNFVGPSGPWRAVQDEFCAELAQL